MNYPRPVGYEDDYMEGAIDRAGSESLDLQHYLRLLRKHKWPIVLFTSAVTALAAYYAFTATPIYRATSTLLIEEQRANVVSIEELYGIDSDNADYYETQFQLLRSRALAQRVVTRMDLWSNPELSRVAAQAAQAQPSGEIVAGSGSPADAGKPAGITPAGIGEKLTGLLESVGLGGLASGTGQTEANAEFATSDGNTTTRVVEPGGVNTTLDTGLDTGLNTPEASLNVALADVENESTLDKDQERVIASFMRRLSISPVRNTKLVNISFESSDPALAARVANIVGEEYIQSFLDAKLELTTTASEWLTERLGELKADLDRAEDRLIAFQRENDLVDVQGSVGRLNEQQLLLNTAELTQARSELAAIQDVYNDVQGLLGSPGLLETIPAVQADPLVQRTKIEQGTVQRELDELSNRYGERHPRVLDAKSELASLNGALEGHINRVAGTIAKDYQLAQQRVASINSKLASGRADIQVIGNKKFELDALQREVETKQGVYDQYFSRMTEANSADGLETANARISDFARVPLSPVKPKKQLIVALAALASLVLSMLMAFLYETMDDTIKSTNDIEVKLGQKLLGILPLVKSGLLKRARELPLDPEQIPDKKGTFAEAVNTIRTALTLDDGEEPRKVIVITSSVPSEGKSTASINIAHSLGQLERVLLIDCDLRRPTVAKAAGLDKNVDGLSNLITRTASARSCIRRGEFGGKVDILPSGPIPDQPLELLSSGRFEKIIKELGQYYDRIVIDSAPTQAVSDALVLSRIADGVVYVVKSHDTSIDLVRRGLTRLEQAKASIAGILITQVDIDKITSYGGDYYYQGYYDYYGYTDKGERNKRPGKITLTQEELLAIRNDDGDVDLDLHRIYGNSERGEGRTREAQDRYEEQALRGDNLLDDELGYEEFRREPAADTRAARASQRARLHNDLDIL